MQSQVRARSIVIRRISGENLPQMRLAEDNDLIQALAAQYPSSVPAIPFCHGDLRVIGRSRMPIAWTRAVKTCP